MAVEMLCWQCSKACNRNSCKWVKYCGLSEGPRKASREEMLLNMPEGVELDKNNYIIFCPEFEKDKLNYSLSDLAKSRNLSLEDCYSKIYVLSILFSNILVIKRDGLDEFLHSELLLKISDDVLSLQSEELKKVVNLYLLGTSVKRLLKKTNYCKSTIVLYLSDYCNLLRDKLKELFFEVSNASADSFLLTASQMGQLPQNRLTSLKSIRRCKND